MMMMEILDGVLVFADMVGPDGGPPGLKKIPPREIGPPALVQQGQPDSPLETAEIRREWSTPSRVLFV